MLLYAGRVSREKGLAALPGVSARLDHARIPHRWVIVGDGPFRSELERRLPRAVFMGTLAHRDVGEPMASADLFVFPSRTDTAGNVVLEAQASGLPVLVSDEGGPKENIHRGVSGLVCGKATAAELADAITTLAPDRSRRTSMCEAARAYAFTRGWDAALEPLYRAYRKVAARASRLGDARDALPGLTGATDRP